MMLVSCRIDPAVFETSFYSTRSSLYLYEISNEMCDVHIFHGQKNPEEPLKCVSVVEKWNFTASQITE